MNKCEICKYYGTSDCKDCVSGSKFKEVEKNCCNCKHFDRDDNEHPCSECKWACFSDEERYEFLEVLWEPVVHTTGVVSSIKDSGQRTEFETGAVRDIQEGKGRCDLMPMDVIAILFGRAFGEVDCATQIFSEIYLFLTSGNYRFLAEALGLFVEQSDFQCWSDMLLEVSVHFEEGAKKYGENNWQKGIPVRRYIDSAVRHYLMWLRGDTDEPHDRAVCWNLMCAVWTCIHKPELNEFLTEEYKNV
jgi:hypothetical protein